MGACAALQSPEGLMNSEVNKEIKDALESQQKIQKLLFLGSGGSGKSTFFKQLKCIHGTGFNDKDRRVFREHISTQIIEQMQRCAECIPYHNERLEEQGLESGEEFAPLVLSDAAKEAAHYLLEEIPPDQLVNTEVAAKVATLWADPAIQQIYKNRAYYHIDDSSAYFFAHIARIGACDTYVPTDLDILYVRYRTTGVIEAQFTIKGSRFNILDVGGQQSERKKWIHCFERVTAVIFVASLSCYDEVMFEDDQVNCMHDSLQLFKEICSLQWFVETPIILFLNKRDLFEAKIHLVPLHHFFPDFTPRPDSDQPQPAQPIESRQGHATNDSNNSNGSAMNDTQPMLKEGGGSGAPVGDAGLEQPLLTPKQEEYRKASLEFIRARFVALSNTERSARSDGKQRQIYTHVTCATDGKNVQKVFNDVQQIVVSAGLERNNLI